MAFKKSDLYSSVWADRDELRGGIDASRQYNNALEACCDKTGALKQEMTQELLTGKTRLV